MHGDDVILRLNSAGTEESTRYSSDYTELDVSSEACEGPSSAKVVRLLIPDEGPTLVEFCFIGRVGNRSFNTVFTCTCLTWVLKEELLQGGKKVFKLLEEGRLSGHFGGGGGGRGI